MNGMSCFKIDDKSPTLFAFKKLNQGHTSQLFHSSTMTSFLTFYELKQFVYVIKHF